MDDLGPISHPDVAREPLLVASGTLSRDSIIRLYRKIMTEPYQPTRNDMLPGQYERLYGPLETIPSQRGAGDA